MTLELGKTYIGKLSALSRERDPMSLRVRLEGLLSTGDWRPSALPAAAILCIRKFRDPSPRSLLLQAQTVRASTNWEHAVRTALDQLIRQAVRPAHDAIPAQAEAVLFADRAELLACLAHDWLLGRLTLHWWWQGLLKAMDLRLAVIHAWLDAPAYAPAALEQLSRWDAAVSFIQTFSAAEAQNLLQSVIRQFSLAELQSALALLLEENKSAKQRDDLLSAQTLVLNTQHLTFNPRRFSPWRRWVPEVQSHELTLEQECLLAISLMLQRTPVIVRSYEFAEAVREWTTIAIRRNVSADNSLTPEMRPEHTQELRVMSTGEAPPFELIKVEGGAQPVAQPFAVVDERDQLTWDNINAVQAEGPFLSREGDAQDIAATTPATPQEPPAINRSPIAEAEAQAPSTTLVASLPEHLTPTLEAAIDTAWGGAFYLINVGLFLGLYGDFTSPRQRGISLPIWDFVALVGRELVGEQIEDDPVWTLLAGLSGRDAGEAPGQNFAPPESWRAPSSWLKPFPEEEAWWWRVVEGRLWVRHPRGFLVLDTPLEGPDVQQQLTREVQAYGSGILLRRALSLPSNTTVDLEPLARWLHWLMLYLRARLQRALGLAESDDPGTLLGAQQARVLVTATHVDIHLSLAELPMAIRLAGLDRDPGWIPAAGRFVAFHFA